MPLGFAQPWCGYELWCVTFELSNMTTSSNSPLSVSITRLLLPHRTSQWNQYGVKQESFTGGLEAAAGMQSSWIQHTVDHRHYFGNLLSYCPQNIIVQPLCSCQLLSFAQLSLTFSASCSNSRSWKHWSSFSFLMCHIWWRCCLVEWSLSSRLATWKTHGRHVSAICSIYNGTQLGIGIMQIDAPFWKG